VTLSTVSQNQTREGRRIAQLFRQSRGLRDIRTCDLEAIVAEDDINVAEISLADPGFTACLLREPNSTPGIFLAPGQDIGRRRFSIAHELGHFHIPRHQTIGAGLHCSDADLNVGLNDKKRTEWEANDFAAELLMPERLFSADASRYAASFESAIKLAGTDMYNVSITAAALRIVQTSRAKCCLVSASRGRINWIARSSACPYILHGPGDPIPRQSAIAGVMRGEDSLTSQIDVDPNAWVDSRNADYYEVYESTHCIPTLDQILTLIELVDSR